MKGLNPTPCTIPCIFIFFRIIFKELIEIRIF
jgi:hypothetical protein